jgi:hypothetical protein
MLIDWQVAHHTQSHGTRYEPNRAQGALVAGEVWAGQQKLSEWMAAHNIIDINV